MILTACSYAATVAQDAAPPNSSDAVAAIEQAIVDAIARVEPSVVAVSRAAPAAPPTEAEERVADFFSELRDPAAPAREPAIVASGVIIDRAGLVLTEYLAVRENQSHSVTTIDGTRYAAKVRAADPRSGLAVLAMETATNASPNSRGGAAGHSGSFTALKIADASLVRKGQLVIAVGNPFAIESDGQPSASWGIVTNLARKASPGTNLNNAPGPLKDFRTTIHHLGTLIQTNAKLGFGTGGGALVNMKGELVGLTTTAAVIAGHERPAGYAIPMNATIRRAVETLKQGREVEYGMLGVGFSPAPIGFGPEPRSPLTISHVYPGPASRAGLRELDVLTRIGGETVDDIDDVQLAVSSHAPGDTIALEYERGGRKDTAQVKLAKLAVAGEPIATVEPDAWNGMRVDYATALDAQALAEAIQSGALHEEDCVLVTEVERDSIAWQEGVRPGMFVTHVGGSRVTTPEEFRAATAKLGDRFDLDFTKPLSPEAEQEKKVSGS